MAVIRRNPNKSPNKFVPTTPNKMRLVKRLKDNAVKNMESLFAARMVGKGLYEYIDGGPDDSQNLPKRKKFVTAMNKPSEVIQLATAGDIKVTGTGDKYTGPTKSIRTDSDINQDTATLPPKPDRKVTRRADIPQAKLDHMMNTNASNPIPVTSSRSAGSLKGIMDKVRNERTK